ncbi:MAG TPA: hypothetical protein VH109_05415 [Steroidobacteraceae bacterium]|jgi:hypothetical protein|nr:hypothetical protein [Steroidobacteraceae bacterium]
MSAVLLAVFSDLRDADRVRTRLVSDGFPTDRVELTAQGERGRAGVQPGSPHQQFRQYFRTLLSQESERVFAELLAQRVEEGAAVAVAVHPRGQIETRRAAQILESEGAQEVVGHDLENQSFEHAASSSDGYWVRHFVPDNPSGADCIYCRLFPGHRH